MSDHLHIVCLDAPSPPDYGGAIDMYYKIAALAASGKKIILHYFNYKKGRSASGLEKYCIEINAYTRKTGWAGFSLFRPYIISSRINQQLINRLNLDDHPILLEGLHCHGIVSKLRPHRKVVLRAHNDEAAYYRSLGRWEKNLFKKAYFLWESLLLHRYQKGLSKSLPQACIARTDIHSLAKKYGADNLYFIPAFVPWQQVSSMPGTGAYCLYHGNMGIAENNGAALWLIQNVFSVLKTEFIIAGKNIPPRLLSAIRDYPHIKLVQNPTDGELEKLIGEAQVNVLPSFNSTGLKIKILHALFRGRYCLTNNEGIAGTGYEAALETANTPQQFIRRIAELMNQPFTDAEIEKRKTALAAYNNKVNAEKLNTL